MQTLLSNLKISVSPSLYISDPSGSQLGQKIIAHSIVLIDKLGFEKFTFRKLAEEIDSTEASIYRYFKNKNQLLCYLIAWYWGWMEYRLVFETANVTDVRMCLEKAVGIMTSANPPVMHTSGMDLQCLHRIILAESSKSYLTKDVDKINQEGAYANYKQFVQRVAELITEVNPGFIYPNMLVSTIIEGAHLQHFFAAHLPRLTNKQDDNPQFITDFFSALLFKTISA